MGSDSQGTEGDHAVTIGSNRLLDALPADHKRHLKRLLRTVFLDVGTVVVEEGKVVESIDFPRTCVVSLASPFPDGSLVEVAIVGSEGIVGVPLVSRSSLPMRAICSVSGWADRMNASAYLRESTSNHLLRELVSDYVQVLFGEIAQVTACNRLHSTQARLARWLLMTQDRVGSEEFAITPELLSRLLGARRATVTLCAETLQAAGLIAYQRGRVTIIDRAGLVSVACECYGSIKAELDGVVDRAVRRSLA